MRPDADARGRGEQLDHVTFNFPNEPVWKYPCGGTGALYTASGLGVLEHLAIVPTAGTGIYNLYLDNFAVAGPRPLTWSLGAGAPANASIDPVSGVFTWTPTEAQAPGIYSIPVVVTDNALLKATRNAIVSVLQTNSAPVLAPISNRTVYAGTTVSFTVSATDTDQPPQTLTYSLDAGAPAGASVDPASGVFVWPTTDAQANTTNSITVRVTDNGSPPLSAAQAFTITVRPRPGIATVALSGTNLTLSWGAIPNTTFQVQYKTNLTDAVWRPLGTNILATGACAMAVDASFGAAPQRFYRLQVVDR